MEIVSVSKQISKTLKICADTAMLIGQIKL